MFDDRKDFIQYYANGIEESIKQKTLDDSERKQYHDDHGHYMKRRFVKSNFTPKKKKRK